MQKYQSFDNTYKLKPGETYEGLFEVQEKIHGANFQVRFDEKGLPHYASRNQEVSSLEEFYKATDIQETVDALPKKPNLIYFGEVFGQGVQKGVFYSNRKEFLVFDIYHTEECRYLTQKEIESILPPRLRVPVLFVGTFDECVAYDIEFNSLIPNESLEDNLCEGVVIKPYDQDIYNRFGERVIFKKKNARFSEISKQHKTPKEHAHIDHLLPYLNENRINAYLSKVGGKVTDMGVAIKAVAEDIVKDFGGEVSKAEEKALRKCVVNHLLPHLP